MFDANPSQRCELFDVPSDERISDQFDFKSAGRIVFMAPEYSRDAVNKFARLLTNLHPRCDVLTTVYDEQFLPEVQQEYARLNEIEEIELPSEIEQLKLDFSDPKNLEQVASRIMAKL